MYGDDALTILAGKVLDVAGRSMMIAPGIRVELPPDYAECMEVGQRVVVRARRVRGRYLAESVLVEDAPIAAGPRCRHCGGLLTRGGLEDECEACQTTNDHASPLG